MLVKPGQRQAGAVDVRRVDVDIVRVLSLIHILEDYVMQFPQSVELFDKIRDLLDFLIPLYVAEGKSQLTISRCV